MQHLTPHTTGSTARVVRRTGVLAVATLSLASWASVAPASAQTLSLDDGDDTSIRADIGKVKVVHGDKRLRVRVEFDDLLRNPTKISQALTIFVDTDAEDKGPEYSFAGGLNSGTDYVLTSIDRWADEGERVADCHQGWKLDWKDDFVVASVGRKCLGKPDTVRVAVKSGEWRKGKGTRYDWLTGRRTFTEWLTAG